MNDNLPNYASFSTDLPRGEAPGDPCVIVFFGATGDLMKRLLLPALYNLACEKLLPEKYAIVGVGRSNWSTQSFRERMTQDIKTFSTRPQFDEAIWNDFVGRLHYSAGPFDDLETYNRLGQLLGELASEYKIPGNVLFYLATPPTVFGLIAENVSKSGLSRSDSGWRRIIIEKPFGNDLNSAIELNRRILSGWSEDQVYRIDHYLGKETVQNILAFRFANRLFEAVWNKDTIDHIQLTVSESVGVEDRGDYYERSGVLRDMMQNHMFQMLCYLCMEPPASSRADAIRNEKVKLLESIRVIAPAEVPKYAVRGQYGPGENADGKKLAGYREEPKVNPESKTETFAAFKLFIDNWRWEGVPIYLRSGKRAWKKGTEIVVQFKKTPPIIFRNDGSDPLEPNRLIFHIQPDQAIELRFQAKLPGPTMKLQDVNMRFGYGEVFKAAKGTGYEFLIYSAMEGDATLFSRTDLVEASWRIAQPILDYWAKEPVSDFPNYPAASWGPRAAFDLIENDGRKWIEIVNRDFLQQIPIFHNADARFLNSLVILLTTVVVSPGGVIIRKGEQGNEMYIISRGEVEVLDDTGQPVALLNEGSFFGELSLLLSEPRNATVRAKTYCDLFVLSKEDFRKALRDHPEFATAVLDVVRRRYNFQGKA